VRELKFIKKKIGDREGQCESGRIKKFLVALASINHFALDWRRKKEEKKMSSTFHFEKN
jgi:hypothetical protein